MSQEKIVLCFPVSEPLVETIRSAAGETEVIVSGQENIAEDIFEATIFCGHAKQKQVDWSKVVEHGRLKWIQSSAAGLDHCLAPEVVNSDILVSGCSALFANQVAEQTFALAFGLLRSLPVFFRAQNKQEFIRRPTDEMHGKTVGIVGFGGNGRRIAELLRPMASRILATDCFPDFENQLADEVFPPSELGTLLEQSDIVILTLPLTPENDGSFGAEQFSKMKKGSYFVNVGRGSVVQHDALVAALDSGHLAGCGFDVCEPEPLPESHPLWEMENVIITPHVGAQSQFRVPMTVTLFCQNLERYRRQEPLFNLVDKSLGFPRPEFRISAQHPMFTSPSA